jgi:hypothetical protein
LLQQLSKKQPEEPKNLADINHQLNKLRGLLSEAIVQLGREKQ